MIYLSNVLSLPLFFGFELTEDVVLYVALHRARFLLGNESTLSTRIEIPEKKMPPNKKSNAKVTSRRRGTARPISVTRTPLTVLEDTPRVKTRSSLASKSKTTKKQLKFELENLHYHNKTSL